MTIAATTGVKRMQVAQDATASANLSEPLASRATTVMVIHAQMDKVLAVFAARSCPLTRHALQMTIVSLDGARGVTEDATASANLRGQRALIATMLMAIHAQMDKVLAADAERKRHFTLNAPQKPTASQTTTMSLSEALPDTLADVNHNVPSNCQRIQYPENDYRRHMINYQFKQVLKYTGTNQCAQATSQDQNTL